MTEFTRGTSTALPSSDLPEILRPGVQQPSQTATVPHANGISSTGGIANHNVHDPVSIAYISPSGFYPLSTISLTASLLGLALGLSSSLGFWLVYTGNALWRGPFFIASLSIFHFLEFYTTARYNTPLAKVTAFLLTQNGYAYNIAHTLALLETLVTHWSGGFYEKVLPAWVPSLLVVTGLLMMALGQVVRSVAMVNAGMSFNHTVQRQKLRGHVLVTKGVYGWLRHPSYFGFFWWALGSQLVLGNVVCFLGYVVVLWKFFQLRIREEEKYLVAFFGQDYEAYRTRTGVGIPFIK